MERRGSTSSRGSSLDSWTLIGNGGAEQDSAGTQASQADDTLSVGSETSSSGVVGAAFEAMEEPSSGEKSSAESEFAHVSDDSELEELRAGADDDRKAAEEVAALEATLKEHPLIAQGEYVIDQDKLHRLFDALCNIPNKSGASSSSASRSSESAQGGGVLAEEEDVSEDLPVNWVQQCSNRISNYIHTANSGLNWKLSLLVTVASAMVLGLGIGHFMGSTHNWLRRHRVARQQVDQLRSLQDSLLSCLKKHELQDTLMVGLQHRLASCQDVSSHCGVEERPSGPPVDANTALHAQIAALQEKAEQDRATISGLQSSLTEARRPRATPTPKPSACPSPTGRERTRIAEDWLGYSNLSQILDSYLDVLRDANIAAIKNDTARLVWDQLAQVGEVAEEIKWKLGEHVDILAAEASTSGNQIRQTLETALSRVWDATATALAWQPATRKFDNLMDAFMDGMRSARNGGFHDLDNETPSHSAHPLPSSEAPLRPSGPVAPPPPSHCAALLPPSLDPSGEMRTFRGAAKHSGLWDEIGEEELGPYLARLKRLSRERQPSPDARRWWEAQRRWWLSCDAVGEEDWQGPDADLNRRVFLRANPGLANLIRAWLDEPSSGVDSGVTSPWILERGKERAKMRDEEARSDWLFNRGRDRAERREGADGNYGANDWSFRRGKARSQHRSKGEFHAFRTHHFRSGA